MKGKKGISLPINMIVIVALAVIVIVAVAVFFTSQTTREISRADALRIFGEGCQTLCTGDRESDLQMLIDLDLSLGGGEENAHTEFVDACSIVTGLGDARDHPLKCFEQCNTGCDFGGDLEGGLDDLRCAIDPGSCAGA